MRLFIEKYEVDTDDRFSTMLTAAVDDIRDFGKRNTSFSKTIIIQGTKNNNLLFGQIFDVRSRNDYNPLLPNIGKNFNPAISADAVILNGNIQQLKGVARLLAINIKDGIIEYELQVIGELGGFAARVGAKKIQDLDFSAYDHEYSIANITGSWTNDNGGAGYYYPLIDYGNYSSDKKNWRVGTFRPAIFLKEVIEKMVSGAGYTMDFPLLDTDRLKRIGIPYNRKILTANNTLILDIYNNDYDGITPDEFGQIWIQVFKNGVEQYSTTIGNFGEFSFVVNDVVLSTGDIISIAAQGSYIPFNPTAGSIGAFTTTDYMNYEYNGATTITTSIDVVLLFTELGATVTYPFNPFQNDVWLDISFQTKSSTAIPTPILIGDDVKMNDALPQNILQKDLFSSVLKLFNLYCYEDNTVNKHLVIEPFIDFYTNDIEDWSLKVDRSSNINIKPMSELNARYYNFKFKADSDYWSDLYRKRYNEGYGDRIYDSQFEFVSEKEDVELIFASTPIVGYSGEEKCYSTIFKRTGNEPSVTEEQVDSIIRLMQFKTLTTTVSWNVKNADNSSSLHSGHDWPYAGHVDNPITPTNDLNFGAPKELFWTLSSGDLSTNQFNVYWSSYMAEITDKDSKLMTCTIRLTRKDWYNLAFNKYKWIDGALWRLNKIIDYNATNEDTCKAEFLRVIYKTY